MLFNQFEWEKLEAVAKLDRDTAVLLQLLEMAAGGRGQVRGEGQNLGIVEILANQVQRPTPADGFQAYARIDTRVAGLFHVGVYGWVDVIGGRHVGVQLHPKL